MLPLGDPNIARSLRYWQGTGELPGAMPPLADPDGKFSSTWSRGVLVDSGGRKGAKVLYLRDVEGVFDQLYTLEKLDKHELDAIKALASTLARQSLWPPPPADVKTPDFAFARFVVWPPVGPNPEIGLGRQSQWMPVKEALTSGAATAIGGGAGAAAILPTPTFLMLSSAEQRRIATLRASYLDPPTGQYWLPLIPHNVVMQTRDTIPWMRSPVKMESAPK
jgi:hypothetical protein